MNIKDISPRRAAQNAAFQALPVALILSPLKFLRGGSKTRKGKQSRAPRWMVEMAERAASAGQGGAVQSLARQFL